MILDLEDVDQEKDKDPRTSAGESPQDAGLGADAGFEFGSAKEYQLNDDDLFMTFDAPAATVTPATAGGAAAVAPGGQKAAPRLSPPGSMRTPGLDPKMWIAIVAVVGIGFYFGMKTIFKHIGSGESAAQWPQGTRSADLSHAKTVHLGELKTATAKPSQANTTDKTIDKTLPGQSQQSDPLAASLQSQLDHAATEAQNPVVSGVPPAQSTQPAASVVQKSNTAAQSSMEKPAAVPSARTTPPAALSSPLEKKRMLLSLEAQLGNQPSQPSTPAVATPAGGEPVEAKTKIKTQTQASQPIVRQPAPVVAPSIPSKQPLAVPVEKAPVNVPPQAQAVLPPLWIDAVIPGRAWIHMAGQTPYAVVIGDSVPAYGQVLEIDVAQGAVTFTQQRVTR
jgi:hypothetical protein